MTEPIPTEENTRLPDHPVHPLFIDRWSARSFSDEQVSDETLFSVLEAARWAPSGNNLQPWRFIVARSSAEKQAFHAFIAPQNRVWCEKAPVLIALISETVTATGQAIGSHAFDAGTAWGYLALEATHQGLITHAMGGFDRELARTALSIPAEYAIHVIIALGYRGDKSQLPEALQQRETPNARRFLVDSVYASSFGQTLE
jgi:nitroreductase